MLWTLYFLTLITILDILKTSLIILDATYAKFDTSGWSYKLPMITPSLLFGNI